MLEYDTNFIVKYKAIERELANTEFDKEDKVTVLDELYRHEVLSVFKTQNINDAKIYDTLAELSKQIKTYELFYDLMQKYKQCYFMPDTDDTIVFTSLFSYDTFYLVHPFVCDFLTKEEIQSPVLDNLAAYMENMQPPDIKMG